jgi:hypothetical protein
MSQPAWTLTDAERATLGAALDALLPPDGTFPHPSQTRMIDDFICAASPRLAAGGSRILVSMVTGCGRSSPCSRRRRTWPPRSRRSSGRPPPISAPSGNWRSTATTRGPRRSPLPLGYAHAIEPWDATDPLQNPQHRRGSYLPTEAVRRVDLGGLPTNEERR